MRVIHERFTEIHCGSCRWAEELIEQYVKPNSVVGLGTGLLVCRGILFAMCVLKLGAMRFVHTCSSTRAPVIMSTKGSTFWPYHY